MRARVASVLLAAALLLGCALAAGAEMQWIERSKFSPAPGSPDTQQFTVTIQEGGSFSASILCQGEEGKPYVLHLVLQPEDGGDPQATEFRFTGSGCG